MPHHKAEGITGNFKQLLKKNTYKEKIILFLPTRRNDKSFHVFKYGFSEKKIEEFAKSNNCKFFISHHPTNANKIIPDYKSDKIQTLKLNGNSIDDALSSADLLVTDYGSVFADYLIFSMDKLNGGCNGSRWRYRKSLLNGYCKFCFQLRSLECSG